MAKMPGAAIALVAVYGAIGILEVVFTWWGAFTQRAELLAYQLDSLAQTPLAIVLLAGLVGLVLGRRWSLRALLVYAAAGVALGLASALSVVAHGAALVQEAGYWVAPAVVFTTVFLFALNSGGALVLLMLIWSKSTRKSLFEWTDGPRVA